MTQIFHLKIEIDGGQRKMYLFGNLFIDVLKYAPYRNEQRSRLF